MIDDAAFANRLKKRAKHLGKWAARWPTDAYRVYDWDMPEFPYAVDRYADRVVIQEFVRTKVPEETRVRRLHAAQEAVEVVLGADREHQHHKLRQRQKGKSQYERSAGEGTGTWVTEGPCRFWVELDTYIDTGLFLDHRELRRRVAEEVGHRAGGTLLNLFGYTGAFSVWAAHAGAKTSTVDLSKTYLDWARRNLEANGLAPGDHRLIRADVSRFLREELGRDARYDWIVLDPPTFSRSKRMDHDLDIQRDHPALIRGAMDILADDGVLFFSNNFRDFVFAEELAERYQVEETTKLTLPDDIRRDVHRSWRITRP